MVCLCISIISSVGLIVQHLELILVYFNLYRITYLLRMTYMPQDTEGKLEFNQKLQKYGVSLKEFRDSLEQNEVQ